MGSERPENCPVDSFQWRTGGSPGKRVATIEIAEHSDRKNSSLFTLSSRPERSEAERSNQFLKTAFYAVLSTIFKS